MKRKIVGLFIVVAILSVVILIVYYAGKLPNDKPRNTGALPRPDLIKTATPQRQDFMETCRWFGTVESREKARIVALETGRIVSVDAGDGIPVTKGALLFSIGGPVIDSRLEVLRNKSAALQKRVSFAERTVGIKRDAVSRKLATYEEIFSAEDALARLKAELESARQEIRRFQTAIHVRATLAGVFTNRKVSAGQEVRKGDNLAEIISVNHIYIAATLFPRENVELEGKRAVIDFAGGNSIPGTITSVLPQKTAEGAVVAWMEVPDSGQVLRPGEPVSGMIALSVHKKALAIPQSAVVRDEEERPYVFLKDSSGYRKQPVETGIVAGGIVEITSGLKWRDEVVVRGAYELFYRDFKKMYKVTD